MILKKFFKCGAFMFLLVIINTDSLFKLHWAFERAGEDDWFVSVVFNTSGVRKDEPFHSIPVYTASLTNVHSKTLTSELSYR